MDNVIVVGAGPAGNNAAYRLASLGHKVRELYGILADAQLSS